MTTSVHYSECFLLELSEQCVHHLGSVSSFGFRWQAVITKVRLTLCSFYSDSRIFKETTQKEHGESHRCWESFGVINSFALRGKIRAQWARQSTDLMSLVSRPGDMAKVFQRDASPVDSACVPWSCASGWEMECWKLKERQIKYSKTLTTVILTWSHVFPLYLNPPMYLSWPMVSSPQINHCWEDLNTKKESSRRAQVLGSVLEWQEEECTQGCNLPRDQTRERA